MNISELVDDFNISENNVSKDKDVKKVKAEKPDKAEKSRSEEKLTTKDVKKSASETDSVKAAVTK